MSASVTISVDVIVAGAGVMVEVKVVVNFLRIVIGTVTAYEFVLTAVDLAP